MEAVRLSKFQSISQLCSDWWELTDEEEYSLVKFERIYKEEKQKKELRCMIAFELLVVAVVNYFTSSPELIRPTHLQLNQVKNMINIVHQNFMIAVELVLSKLPIETLQNVWATQLQGIVKAKKAKRGGGALNPNKKSDVSLQIRQNNENIANILKNLARQGNVQHP